MINMEVLEQIFQEAKKYDSRYVGIKVQMDTFEKPEVIINENANIIKKLEYYKKAYNNDLTLKTNPSIRIIDATYGNNYDSIEYDLVEG